MSILRYKQKVMFADGGVLRDSGGGGGGPTSTKTETSNIPDYARPYVENMLGATQKQLFNTTKTGDKAATYDSEGNELTPAVAGSEQITGFKPYQAYSTNVNDYFAGPSAMQKQSYQGMANMQVAPQLAEGSIYANQAGQGMLGTTGQAGLYGALGAMAGQNYANQATNPNSIAAYMSPYMQNVVDYQKGQALRDYGMAMPKIQAQAVGQGAFGGNRMALQQAEAGRGLMSQLQGIEAQGSQKAFDAAQQAQQYGANLGLQGLGLGLQGVGAQQAGYGGALNAGTALGQLGQTQYGQQMGILQGQNQFGLQQQQMEQAKINQGISDYATAQQYPYMQLGMMSNMLRGLPMQSTSTQMYQNPSAISQLGGLAATGLGAYGAAGGFRNKKGGSIKVKKYDVGGEVEADLEAMEPARLAEIAKTSQSQEIREKASRILAEKVAAQRAQQSMGLASAPAPNMDGMATMAGGGIVAFATGKAVKDPALEMGGEEAVNRYLEKFGYNKPSEEIEALKTQQAQSRADIKNTQDQNLYRSIMMGGAKTMAGTSPNAFANFGAGLEEGLGSYAKGEKDYGDMLNKIRTGEIDIAKLSVADRDHILNRALGATKIEEDAKTRRQVALDNALNRGQAAGAARDDTLFKSMYATNVKAQEGIVKRKLTEDELNDIANNTLTQLQNFKSGKRNVVSGAGGKGGSGSKGEVDTNNALLKG
jgi:hypothetical protein